MKKILGTKHALRERLETKPLTPALSSVVDTSSANSYISFKRESFFTDTIDSLIQKPVIPGNFTRVLLDNQLTQIRCSSLRFLGLNFFDLLDIETFGGEGDDLLVRTVPPRFFRAAAIQLMVADRSGAEALESCGSNLCLYIFVV